MSEQHKQVPAAPARVAASTGADDEPRPSQIAHDIEKTRAHMTETISAIEHRLNPTELREKAVEELHVVEDKVREVVKEQFEEAKAKVKEELIEAKDHAKDEVKQAIRQAKQEVKDAFHEASQALRDATIGKVEHMARRANDTMVETSETVIGTIRANPLPAALTGLGLLWLFMNRTSHSNIRVRYREDDRREGARRAERRSRADELQYPPQRYGSQGYASMNPGFQGPYEGRYAGEQDARYAGAGRGYRDDERRYEQGGIAETMHRAQHAASDAVHRAQDAAGHMAHDVGHKVSGMAHQVADTASHAAHQVADTASHAAHQVASTATQAAHQVAHTATDLAHRASDTVDHLGHEARVQARHVEDKLHETMQTNPLALGAVALAVGTVVGLSLPHTRREDELLGETRDRLIGRAEHAAQGALETAHQYTDQAADRVRGALHEGEPARG